MNKILLIVLTSIFLLYSFSLVSATISFEANCAQHFNIETGTFDRGYENCARLATVVSGRVIYSDGSYVPGALVKVVCYHDNGTITRTTTSVENITNPRVANPADFIGLYHFQFLQAECHTGDRVVVTAEKDGLAGEIEGVVNDSNFIVLDLAFFNITLVPEFGMIAGLATLIGAVGIFFFVRKK